MSVKSNSAHTLLIHWIFDKNQKVFEVSVDIMQFVKVRILLVYSNIAVAFQQDVWCTPVRVGFSLYLLHLPSNKTTQ